MLPATFLIDRQGRLRPALAPEQPFESVAASADAVLTKNPSQKSFLSERRFMERRKFLALTGGVAGAQFSVAPATLGTFAAPHESDQASARQPVFVPSGFTRETDGTNQRAPTPSGMFDTEVVRASDSEGGLRPMCFRPETIIRTAVRLFTFITSRMSGFISWLANSSPKLAAGGCASNPGILC